MHITDYFPEIYKKRHKFPGNGRKSFLVLTTRAKVFNKSFSASNNVKCTAYDIGQEKKSPDGTAEFRSKGSAYHD